MKKFFITLMIVVGCLLPLATHAAVINGVLVDS